MHFCLICDSKLVGFIGFVCSGCVEKMDPEDKKKFLKEKRNHLISRFSIAIVLLIVSIALMIYGYTLNTYDMNLFLLVGILLFIADGLFIPSFSHKNFKSIKKYQGVKAVPSQTARTQTSAPIDLDAEQIIKAVMGSLQGQSTPPNSVLAETHPSTPMEQNAAQILRAMTSSFQGQSTPGRREPTMKNDSSRYQQVLHGILPLSESGKSIIIERPYFELIVGSVCTKASLKDMEFIALNLDLSVGEPVRIEGGKMHILRDTLQNFLTNELETFMMMNRKTSESLTNIHNPKNLPFEESKLLDYSEKILEFMKNNAGFYTEDRWNR